jgi:ribosomal protein L12E/L44/L45/RPP1/RPP2
VAVAVRSCFAGAALGLTVYLSEDCAVAGGQAIVQAALQAVWGDRDLLDSLDVPQAVLEAAAAAEAAKASSSRAAAAGEGVGTSHGSDSIGQQQQQQEEVEEEDEASDSEQGSGFVDDYLRAPAVTIPVRPTVVYVTVPVLPRG